MFRHIITRSPKYNKLKAVLLNHCSTKSSNVISYKRVFRKENIHTTSLTYNFKHATISNQIEEKQFNKLNEREFLVKLKYNPDVFGGGVDTEPELDPGDLEEEKFLTEKPFTSQKLTTKKYADIIKGYLQKRQIKEAIDVVEIRMIEEDRVQPENYIYNLVIGGCSRVGYTKKAFSLYNTMKKRNLKVTPGTYTALFNACANSPWPEDGLTRARHLREIMLEKMYEPNLTNYNAMIKAFGRCGDLETAFKVVDEMCAKRTSIKDDTLNFLLQACISDKEAGFRHALLVWRKFIKKNIKPSVFSYNLMLRCIRDCGLGDLDVTTDVIKQLVGRDKQVLLPEQSGQKLIGKEEERQQTLENNDVGKCLNVENVANEEVLINKPNLMAKIPHLGSVLSLSEVNKPEDRLLLVGGCNEFLQNMADNGCTPDIKTFTQLLDSVPSTLAAEKNLLQALRKNNIKPDIDFFNMLIKKRSMRFDYDSAKEVLTMLKTANFRPNLITYGVLGLGCKTKEEALSLLKEMLDANYRMNIEILGAMLTQACYHNNFPYVMQLMEMCISEEVPASKMFLEKLEEFKKKSKKISNDVDDPHSQSIPYQKGYRIFKMRYTTWLEEVQIENTENTHPWKQYQQTTDTNVRHYKDKEAKTKFKPVHTTLFRQKSKVENVKVLKNKSKR